MAPPIDFEKKIIYPPGVKDITEDISTDDLVRRLKDCATQFQNLNQEDDNSVYIPLACHLVNEYFMEHDSKEVRILVACIIADVFRAFAPDAPYKDPLQLKMIFEFFVDQLKGLEKPKQGQDGFKRYYFYLLENFAWVKTFNLCLELEDSHAIIYRLFKHIFAIISEEHSSKVRKFILDILVPLINEADNISPELLDFLLLQIIEPQKSKRRPAYLLAKDILSKTATFLEPSIQAFFNNTLILGKTEKNKLALHQYELIYELNNISQSLMVSVLPQLEFKLKSPDTEERLAVTQLLAKLFSEKGSNLAKESKPLWNGFIGRFNDISVEVRECIVRSCINFLINHPELHKDMTEFLRQRLHDNDDNVRLETVKTILSAFRKDLNCVNKELLVFLKERALDKKFKVRKEAACGLGQLYRERTKNSIMELQDETFSWIKDKILHLYYQNNLDDKLLVERLLLTCMVPYKYPLDDKMKRLYHLVASVDDYAFKALRELLRCQTMLRNHMMKMLEKISSNTVGNNNISVQPMLPTLCRALPESMKAQEYIPKFSNELEASHKLRNTMFLILNGENSCTDVEHNLRLTLKSFGQPSATNAYYMAIKQLLERIAPLLVDKQGVLRLVEYTRDALLEAGNIEKELGISDSAHRNITFLQLLSTMFPATFKQEKIYESFLLFLQSEDEICISATLQILMQISSDVKNRFPEIAEKMIPLLENFAETGNIKQAKYAVYCLDAFVLDKETFFENLIEKLTKHFTLDSQYFRTALVSIGHIAYLCHDMFENQLKKIVSQVIVKGLLNSDQDLPRGGYNDWGPLETLPDETKVKIAGMKLMIRWLMGLKNAVKASVSTLRLFSTIIDRQGDLTEAQYTAPRENSWLRLTAASCILKLCQEPNYVSSLSVEQFQIVAATVHDSCYEVRERFIQKIHKNLLNLKLPLEFMALFAFCGIEENKSLKQNAKTYLAHNVLKRRDYLKQNPIPNRKLLSYLPDYVMPYVIYMLAHSKFYDNFDDVSALRKIQDCLWFILEHLVTKNESYSFSFLKRLLENVKQTKDTQNPDDEEMNKKIYAVTDLAMSILLTKVTSIVMHDFPVEPTLPTKLFTPLSKDQTNIKTYLPREVFSQFSTIAKFELGIFEDGDKSKLKEPTKSFNDLLESTRSSRRNKTVPEAENTVFPDDESNSSTRNDEAVDQVGVGKKRKATRSAAVSTRRKNVNNDTGNDSVDSEAKDAKYANVFANILEKMDSSRGSRSRRNTRLNSHRSSVSSAISEVDDSEVVSIPETTNSVSKRKQNSKATADHSSANSVASESDILESLVADISEALTHRGRKKKINEISENSLDTDSSKTTITSRTSRRKMNNVKMNDDHSLANSVDPEADPPESIDTLSESVTVSHPRTRKRKQSNDIESSVDLLETMTSSTVSSKRRKRNESSTNLALEVEASETLAEDVSEPNTNNNVPSRRGRSKKSTNPNFSGTVDVVADFIKDITANDVSSKRGRRNKSSSSPIILQLDTTGTATSSQSETATANDVSAKRQRRNKSVDSLVSKTNSSESTNTNGSLQKQKQKKFSRNSVVSELDISETITTDSSETLNTNVSLKKQKQKRLTRNSVVSDLDISETVTTDSSETIISSFNPTKKQRQNKSTINSTTLVNSDNLEDSSETVITYRSSTKKRRQKKSIIDSLAVDVDASEATTTDSSETAITIKSNSSTTVDSETATVIVDSDPTINSSIAESISDEMDSNFNKSSMVGLALVDQVNLPSVKPRPLRNRTKLITSNSTGDTHLTPLSKNIIDTQNISPISLLRNCNVSLTQEDIDQVKSHLQKLSEAKNSSHLSSHSEKNSSQKILKKNSRQKPLTNFVTKDKRIESSRKKLSEKQINNEEVSETKSKKKPDKQIKKVSQTKKNVPKSPKSVSAKDTSKATRSSSRNSKVI